MGFFDNYRPLNEEYVSDEGLRQKQQELAKRLNLTHLGKGIYANTMGSKFTYNKVANNFEPISDEEIANKKKKKSKKPEKTPEPPPTDLPQSEVIKFNGRDEKTGKPKYERVNIPLVSHFTAHDENFNVHQDNLSTNDPKKPVALVTSGGTYSVHHTLTGAKIVSGKMSSEEAEKEAKTLLNKLSKEKLDNMLTRFHQDFPVQHEKEEKEPEIKKKLPDSHFRNLNKKYIDLGNKIVLKYMGGIPDHERKDLTRILKGLLKPTETLEKEVLRIRGGKSSYSSQFVKIIKSADFLQKQSPEIYKNFHDEWTNNTGLPKPTRETLDLVKWSGDGVIKVQIPIIASFRYGGMDFHIHRSVYKVGDEWKAVKNSYSVSSDFGGRILDGNTVKGVYRRAKDEFRKQGREKVRKIVNDFGKKVN